MATIKITLGDGKAGAYANRTCCAFNTLFNTVTKGVNGFAGVFSPTEAFLTGTITASNPVGGYAEYSTRMGVDARNNAGTTGTIQLIAPTLIYSYSLPGQFPPKNGTGTVGSPTTGTSRSSSPASNSCRNPAGPSCWGSESLGY